MSDAAVNSCLPNSTRSTKPTARLPGSSSPKFVCPARCSASSSLLGSFTDRSMDQLYFALPFVVAGAVLVFASARALDALTLGEDTATSLGFNQTRVKLLVIIGTGLAVGATVAVAGVIGFVGLVVPHIVRPLVGHQPSRLLLPSALAGAALLLAADLLVRLPVNGPEPKLGVVTSLIGAPFFLWLILRTRREAP